MQRRYLSNISFYRDGWKTFAGLRPEPPDAQWIIEAYDDPWGFVNVAGIRSPGLTGAPAIAHYVKNLLIEKLGVQLEEKAKWNPSRKRITRINELSTENQKQRIRANPKYGNVVCMCKDVTEAEIMEAIRRMRDTGIKTITMDGIKFRTQSMFGKCQGSFCRLRIARIIAREEDIPIWEVTKNGEGTKYGIGDVKRLRQEHERKEGMQGEDDET